MLSCFLAEHVQREYRLRSSPIQGKKWKDLGLRLADRHFRVPLDGQCSVLVRPYLI